ncbi:MAG: transposase [Thermodesulfobacteriota bacterium]
MPRGPRLDTEGALHHIMVRGLEGRKIFSSNTDRRDLVGRFASVVPETEARVYAWSLMPNHFHLLVRTGRMRLSSIMRKILTGYAVSFNSRHKRLGHLFQNRYKSILVEEEPYLLELVRYIHLNPLRAGLVAGIEELDSYPWSGHAVLMGKGDHSWQDSEYILTQFARRVEQARRAYWEFVLAGIDQGRRDDLVGGGLVRSVGGWKQVKALRRGREKWSYDERILGSGDFVRSILDEAKPKEASTGFRDKVPSRAIDSLIEVLASRLHLSSTEVTGGGRWRRVIEARSLISYVAVREYGMSLTEVSRALGVSKQSILRGVERGERVLREKGWRVKELIA